VLLGIGLYDELITLPGEAYRLGRVVVCDLETSWMRKPWPTGAVAPKTNKQTKPPRLTLNMSTFWPHSVFIYFVWISVQTVFINLCNINRFCIN